MLLKLLEVFSSHFGAIAALVVGLAAVALTRRRFPDCDKASRLWDLADGFFGFLHDNAGRVLVLAVFLVLLGLAYHAAGDPSKAKFAEFCQSKAGEAFASFLSLIVGARLAGTNGNGNGNGNKPVQP